MKRCWWVPLDDELYVKYHDNEWGKPQKSSKKLFEFLLLEMFQAGLSWRTILHKRENFKKAFDNFDPKKISKYNLRKINSLMKDQGIIRNRKKIESAIEMAKFYNTVNFSKFVWQFEPKKKTNNTKTVSFTKESENLSNALKSHGIKFVGPTICYAFMQACGIVNDHDKNCSFR